MKRSGSKTFGGHHSILYGRRKIAFSVSFSDRQHLTINVHPDMRVNVKAPLGKALSEIVKRVERRAGWISKQLNHFERFHPLPTERQYVSGETHVYLGRQYLLKVIRSELNEVKLIGRYLRVYLPEGSRNGHAGSLVDIWYAEHARRVLDHRLNICLGAALRAGLPQPKVKVRKMKSRWGSCAKTGTITLNTELVKAPVHCIDYVITHELCHLKYKNHSPAFWRLLSKLMPDWGERKIRMESVVI